jgi:inhibitor of KinA sporulation pathway (predicted exonuclease)
VIRIVYDLEATCWEGQPHADKQEIIELGAFLVNDYGERIDEFQSYVRPVLAPYLSPYCKELTGITQQEVDRAPLFEEVLQAFWDFLPEEGEELLYVNWGKYDPGYIRGDCRQHDLDDTWLEPVLDLKRSYQKLRGLTKPLGLKSAIQAEGLEFEGKPHSAYWDAYNLSELYLKHFGQWPRVKRTS